jgi:hypothetical protein
MIIFAEAGSELAAIRTLRLGAADYLPKRLITPSRLQRSIKLTLRAIEKEAQRRAERLAQAAAAKADAQKSDNGSGVEKTKETPENTLAPAPLSSISTHTGATLARAAQIAIAPKPSVVQAPTATQTGANLARAARAALTPVPTPAPLKLEASAHDVSAISLPAAVDSIPAVIKESRPVAPENHQIPGYTILQKIGNPRPAAVYLAISEDLGRNVALKISKRRHSGDANDTGQRAIMFQREFEAIAALDHPSVIDLFDYGIHEGVEFLAMEYFPCGDLKARLQNPLTPERRSPSSRKSPLAQGGARGRHHPSRPQATERDAAR